jgi:hypothetical protein
MDCASGRLDWLVLVTLGEGDGEQGLPVTGGMGSQIAFIIEGLWIERRTIAAERDVPRRSRRAGAARQSRGVPGTFEAADGIHHSN